MRHVFVSYASQDREAAAALVEEIEARGWPVWLDKRINPGSYWDEEIERALESAACVVVVWSKTSVQSHWVKTEAEAARERNILLPASLDATQPPYAFRRIQSANLDGWPRNRRPEGFDGLMNGMSQLLATEPRKVAKRTSSKRGISATLMIAAVILIAILLSTLPRPRTEFDIAVKASAVSFTLSRGQELSEAFPVSSITLSGFGSIASRSSGDVEATLASSIEKYARLTPVKPADIGAITFAPLLLSAQSHVFLEKLDPPLAYRFSFEGNRSPVTLNLQHAISVAIPGVATRIFELPGPKAHTLNPGADVAHLDLALNSALPNLLADPISIDNLSFNQTQERNTASGTTIRNASMIRNGVIQVAGSQFELGQNESLRAESSNGVISEIRLDGDALSVRFHGTSKSLSVCPVSQSCQNLSINWAQWFWNGPH